MLRKQGLGIYYFSGYYTRQGHVRLACLFRISHRTSKASAATENYVTEQGAGV